MSPASRLPCPICPPLLSIRSAQGLAGQGMAESGLKSGNGIFGTDVQSSGLTGRFFDLKQTRDGVPTKMTPGLFSKVLVDFVNTGWPESTLTKYYCAPHHLTFTQLFLPWMSDKLGPKAFGLENDINPRMWIVYYKGRVQAPDSGTYHFVGAADDMLFVRFNGQTVLEGGFFHIPTGWKGEGAYTPIGYQKIKDGYPKGTAFTVEAGKSYPIEILFGEDIPTAMSATLLIEKDGESYQHDARMNPILPLFRTGDFPLPSLDALQPNLTYPPHQEGGPIWPAEPAEDM